MERVFFAVMEFSNDCSGNIRDLDVDEVVRRHSDAARGDLQQFFGFAVCHKRDSQNGRVLAPDVPIKVMDLESLVITTEQTLEKGTVQHDPVIGEFPGKEPASHACQVLPFVAEDHVANLLLDFLSVAAQSFVPAGGALFFPA